MKIINSNYYSYNDFVNWTNRQLYLERQAESRFNELGVKIGKKKYKISDIDKIPEALLNDLEDRYRGDFSEEDEKAMWVSLGLSPGNYMYLKTWQERNDNIAKKIRTYAEIYADEHEEAVERNNDLIDKYSREDEKLDINEISKDANLLAMNQEMVLREILRLQIEMHEYELARDKMTESLYNPPRLSDTWGYDPWQSITSGGFSKDEYQDY